MHRAVVKRKNACSSRKKGIDCSWKNFSGVVATCTQVGQKELLTSHSGRNCTLWELPIKELPLLPSSSNQRCNVSGKISALLGFLPQIPGWLILRPRTVLGQFLGGLKQEKIPDPVITDNQLGECQITRHSNYCFTQPPHCLVGSEEGHLVFVLGVYSMKGKGRFWNIMT